MKILSIDFDYFFDCGHSESEWYLRDWGSDEKVKVCHTDIWYYRDISNYKPRSIKNFFKGVNKNTRCVIGDSHLEIMDILEDGCEVINFDSHTDDYTADSAPGRNFAKGWHCGNWANSPLIKKYTCYQPHTQHGDRYSPFVEKKNKIPNIKFDVVFICRSPQYVPPKYDAKFNQFISYFTHRNQRSLRQRIPVERTDVRIDKDYSTDYITVLLYNCSKRGAEVLVDGVEQQRCIKRKPQLLYYKEAA